MNYAINTVIEGFNTILYDDELSAVIALKNNYPKVKCVIGADSNIINAIDAAYKTGSGIALDNKLITNNIYNLNNFEVAEFIVSSDTSDFALRKATYILAKDIYMTGDINKKVSFFSEITDRDESEIRDFINRNLDEMEKTYRKHTKHMPDDYFSKYNKLKSYTDNASILRDIRNGGAFMVNLPTGYGKTTEIIEPAIKEAIINNEKVLLVSHRRSINKNICSNISEIVSYDKCENPKIINNAKGLKIVVNSLSSKKFEKFIRNIDVVVIDEVTQVVRHIFSGEMKEREKVWDTLKLIVKNAKKVIFADADINTDSVEFLDREHSLYSLSANHADIVVKIGSINHVTGLIINSAKVGSSVLVATDNAKAAESLGAEIAKSTGYKPLVITSKSFMWDEQSEFIKNPNSEKHRVVIFSPVITSSLSITSSYFEKHYGLFYGNVVPTDAVQMLRRSRTAKEFILGLQTPKLSNRNYLEPSKEAVDVPATQALIDSITDISLQTKLLDALKRDLQPSFFEKSRQDHLISEAWLKNNIQSSLPATLLAQGFKVLTLNYDQQLVTSGFVSANRGRQLVTSSAVVSTLKSDSATAEVIQRAKYSGTKNETEYFAVNRAGAESLFRKKQVTAKDVEFWNEGAGKVVVRRFRDLMLSGSNFTACQVLLRSAINIMLNEKTWTPEESAQLFDDLASINEKDLIFGVKIGNAKTTKAKQAAITGILKQFGLKTRKVNGGKKGNYYIITKESFAQVNSLAANSDCST